MIVLFGKRADFSSQGVCSIVTNFLFKRVYDMIIRKGSNDYGI